MQYALVRARAVRNVTTRVVFAGVVTSRGVDVASRVVAARVVAAGVVSSRGRRCCGYVGGYIGGIPSGTAELIRAELERLEAIEGIAVLLKKHIMYQKHLLLIYN